MYSLAPPLIFSNHHAVAVPHAVFIFFSQVATDTCLEDARVLIDPLLQCSERDAFSFVSATGGVIPREDERARRVVWDCELPVRLRPASWVAIDQA